MYSLSTAAICIVLFGLMMAGVELGHRVGLHRRAASDESVRSQTNAIQAAVLGLFALLLGFTFTMAIQRYDARNRAVSEEANAIGTAFLRSKLLAPPGRDRAADAIRRYVGIRLQASRVDLASGFALDHLGAEAAMVQDELWELGLAEAERDPNPVTAGLYIQAVNDLIDSQGSRSATLRQHTPELVLLLLLAVFVAGGGVLGYASGLGGGRRPLFATIAMTTLIVLVVFIVIDLDRPRRGLIQSDQTSLIQLRTAVGGG